MGQIRVGTAGWTDRSLIASGWYPAEANTPEKRLRYYARQFPLVEVDATYYALPAEQTARAWAERTPAGFTFNIKAFSLFTQHPTPVKALPADLREAAGQSREGPGVPQGRRPGGGRPGVGPVPGRARAAARLPGKLGAILLQFPPWFPISRANKDYILACAQRAAPRRVCVEFRNRTWMTEDNQARNPGVPGRPPAALRVRGQAAGLPQLHPPGPGRHQRPGRGPHARPLGQVDEQGHRGGFGYRYSEDELDEWASRIRGLAAGADVTHVVFNNCYRDYAHVNARQLEARLGT